MSDSTGRFYRLDRLYFKYLFDSPWEHEITVERLAEILEALNMIRLNADRTRYEELPKFRRYCFRSNFLSGFERLRARYDEQTKGEL